jgi:hypothetical protein
MNDQFIKKYLVRVVKKFATHDIESALKLEDQLKTFIPSTLNPTGIVNYLTLSKCATYPDEIKNLKSILGD